MATALDSQLLKGALTLVLLRLLAERESYGYEIVGRLHDVGLTEVLEGTVYPALNRLERDSLLSSRLVASPSGPARKYYRPSPAGYVALHEAEAAWISLTQVIEPLLEVTVPTRPQEAHA